jgi:hypothetical protein
MNTVIMLLIFKELPDRLDDIPVLIQVLSRSRSTHGENLAEIRERLKICQVEHRRQGRAKLLK